MQPQPPTPQQEAIREVRDRYERGEIAFDTFKQSLDELLQARSPEECRAIVQALPASPARALEALEGAARPPTPAPVAPGPRTRWLVMIMGELKRTKRRWRLAERTNCIALMGETKLDLRLATLPRRGVLRVLAGMGEVTLYVPRSVAVSVQSLVLLGEASALGEHAAGILAMANVQSHDEEQVPAAAEPPVAELQIQMFMAMGAVKVVQVDAPASISGVAPTPQALPQPQ